MMDRRRFLLGSLLTPLTGTLAGCSGDSGDGRSAYRGTPEAKVAILGKASYAEPLVDTILQGIRLFRLNVHGKKVLLKPNLVEFDPAGVINTHPAVVAAAIEAFRRLGAREVLVGDGSGHRRDNEYLLQASGLQAVLQDHRIRYVDLNTDDVRPLALRTGFTRLRQLYFPETVLTADLVVSMPKLKTHHWAGVTLSMKNMFGAIPGSIYGWPKNVLHWAGIDESIVDINSTLTMPRFAIVDGIVGMEGDGPIRGTPRHAGILIFGEDPVAVDATAARCMMIDPTRIPYLRVAGGFLGHLDQKRITQVGEKVEGVAQDFQVIAAFRHFKAGA
jgi:uncharacterized protein (DUF362 family)